MRSLYDWAIFHLLESTLFRRRVLSPDPVQVHVHEQRLTAEVPELPRYDPYMGTADDQPARVLVLAGQRVLFLPVSGLPINNCCYSWRCVFVRPFQRLW